MNRVLKRIIIIFISAAIVSGISFGYWKATQPVKIRMSLYTGNNWGVPQAFAYAIYDTAAEMYTTMPDHPNIEIEYKTGSLYSHYSERLAQQILTGNEPDLFLMVEEDFNTYASIGLLENLNPYIEKDLSFDKNNYYRRALDAGSFRGGQYSLPISIVPSFLIVNKDLLAKNNIEIDSYSWDWEQFLEICTKLTRDTDKDGDLDQFGVYGYDWHQALYSNDKYLFKPDSHEIGFSDKRLKETLDFLKKMHNINKGTQVTEKDFTQGRVGFKVFNYSEYRVYGSYPYRILKYSNFEWDAIPVPSGPCGNRSSKLYTVQVGMSSRSKNKKAAFNFLKFLSSNENFQKEIWHQTNNLPANKNVVQEIYRNSTVDEGSVKAIGYPFLQSIIQNSYIDPNFKWYSSIDEYIDQKIFKIIAMDQNTEEGVAEFRHGLEEKLLDIQ